MLPTTSQAAGQRLEEQEASPPLMRQRVSLRKRDFATCQVNSTTIQDEHSANDYELSVGKE